MIAEARAKSPAGVGGSYRRVPTDRKQRFIDNWWATLISLRDREAQIPNSGGSEQVKV